MSRSKKILITLDKNKSGAMTWEKDPTLENSDLLCPAQLLNLNTWKQHHNLLCGCNAMFENKDIHFIAGRGRAGGSQAESGTPHNSFGTPKI